MGFKEFLIVLLYLQYTVGEWKIAGTRLKTKWAATVDPTKVWPEYPRPQLERVEWVNLNGIWSYSLTNQSAAEPTKYDGDILVPFPIESALSGVQKPLSPDQEIWYHRTFAAPALTANELLIINFGAVDYESHLYINGKLVGEHKGGYNSFSFDITTFLTSSEQQTITLKVIDKTGGAQPIGKQSNNPSGTFFNAASGIWRTVWLEKVPKHHIESLKIVTDIDTSTLHLTIVTNSNTNVSAIADIKVIDSDGKTVATSEKVAINTELKIALTSPKLWSAVSPYLYNLEITVGDDSVKSYFGMRKIEFRKDSKGVNRFFVNNKPIFTFGPLDCGVWPDGIYTPASDEAMRFDLETEKKVGFNGVRKHGKVENDRWYYWADKLGLYVWQDFPSLRDHLLKKNEADLNRTQADKDQIELEMSRMVSQLFNHPSIIVWVPFNEGWGQYDTVRIVGLFRKWDPTRLINEASGWNDHNSSDILDYHSYPHPQEYALDAKRVVVQGEYGGVGMFLKEHAWVPEGTGVWQYISVNTSEKFAKWYLDRLLVLRANAIFTISGAVYTEITDCELENTGLLTYDRAIEKYGNATKLYSYTQKLYPSQSLSSTVLLSGHQDSKQEWHYVTTAPTGNWTQDSYSDTNWNKGMAGFGTSGTPKVVIHTTWNTTDIWLRKKFEIAAGKLPKHPVLYIFYDDIAKVYINDVEIDEGFFNPYQVGYIGWDFDAKLLKEGENIIAVSVHQLDGGQGFDAGILDVCYECA